AALANERCTVACLQEGNVNALADCIAITIDCAAVVRLASACMGRRSKMMSVICAACVEVCERCQDECAKYQMDYCQACLEACRHCAEQCRRMAAATEPREHDSPSDIVAGLRQ